MWKYNICKHRAGNGVGKPTPHHLELTNASARVLNQTKAEFLSPPISFSTLAAKGKPGDKHFQGEASSLLCQALCASSSPHQRFPAENPSKNPGTGTARLPSRKSSGSWGTAESRSKAKPPCPTHTEPLTTPAERGLKWGREKEMTQELSSSGRLRYPGSLSAGKLLQTSQSHARASASTQAGADTDPEPAPTLQTAPPGHFLTFI